MSSAKLPQQSLINKVSSTNASKKLKHSSGVTDTSTSTSTTMTTSKGSCFTSSGSTADVTLLNQCSEPPFRLYHDRTTIVPSLSNAAVTPESAMMTTTPPTFEEGWNSVVQLLRGRKRIAILTGAGISVSCTSHFYRALMKRYIPYTYHITYTIAHDFASPLSLHRWYSRFPYERKWLVFYIGHRRT
jgi:hypothetical protein